MTRSCFRKDLFKAIFCYIKSNYVIEVGNYKYTTHGSLADKYSYTKSYLERTCTLFEKAFYDKLVYEEGGRLSHRKVIENAIEYLKGNKIKLKNISFKNSYGRKIFGGVLYEYAFKELIDVMYMPAKNVFPEKDDEIDELLSVALKKIRKTFSKNSLEELMQQIEEKYLKKYEISAEDKEANKREIDFIPVSLDTDYSVTIDSDKDFKMYAKFGRLAESSNFYISKFLYPQNNMPSKTYRDCPELKEIEENEKKDYKQYCIECVIPKLKKAVNWATNIKWNKFLQQEYVTIEEIKSFCNIIDENEKCVIPKLKKAVNWATNIKRNEFLQQEYVTIEKNKSFCNIIDENEKGKNDCPVIMNVQKIKTYFEENGLTENDASVIIVIYVCIILYRLRKKIYRLIRGCSLRVEKKESALKTPLNVPENETDIFEIFCATRH